MEMEDFHRDAVIRLSKRQATKPLRKPETSAAKPLCVCEGFKICNTGISDILGEILFFLKATKDSGKLVLWSEPRSLTRKWKRKGVTVLPQKADQ